MQGGEMAYRKTPEILAGIAARKGRLINATIAIMARDGVEKVTVAGVAKRARLAYGLAYKYFPDKEEMIAQAVFQLRQMDREAIEAASMLLPNRQWALASTVKVFYNRMKHRNLVRLLMADEGYRRGIEAALGSLVAGASEMTGRESQKAAGAILGLLYGLWMATDGARGQANVAVLFSLRAIGLGEAAAQKVLAAV
jgi:AcrR family transcriptional regulator